MRVRACVCVRAHVHVRAHKRSPGAAIRDSEKVVAVCLTEHQPAMPAGEGWLLLVLEEVTACSERQSHVPPRMQQTKNDFLEPIR